MKMFGGFWVSNSTSRFSLQNKLEFSPCLNFHSCDMIKRNELDVGHIGFEILPKTMFKFLCFILFLALTNSS